MPLKLNVFFGFPSYGGNGGIASEVPDIRKWFARTILKAKSDPRVGEIIEETISDTPITMVRNRFVVQARKANADVLVMVDSDQNPLLHEHESGFRDWWESSFDFVYDHWKKGPSVVGAPYAGPPNGTENMYVFYWENFGGDRGSETAFKLEQYPRTWAAHMFGTGIKECAALPTGMIMYDMRAFDLIEPPDLSFDEVLERYRQGKATEQDVKRAAYRGWFYYEWNDRTASEKASTEDVTNTRDISLAGILKLGYNPVFCNWDSPVGHWKPWCVRGNPQVFGADRVGSVLRDVVESGLDVGDKLHFIPESNIERLGINRDVIQQVSPEKKNGSHIFERKTAPFFHETPDLHLSMLSRIARNFKEEYERAPVVLEVGSWVGESAVAFCEGGARLVYCVDPMTGNEGDWTGGIVRKRGEKEVLARFKQNTDGYPIQLFQCCFHEFDGGFYPDTGNEPEIIFIDAEHDYDSVRRDIECALAMHPAWICGHDYDTEAFPGVTRAVNEAFGAPNVEVYGYLGKSVGGIWMCKNPVDLLGSRQKSLSTTCPQASTRTGAEQQNRSV